MSLSRSLVFLEEKKKNLFIYEKLFLYSLYNYKDTIYVSVVMDENRIFDSNILVVYMIGKTYLVNLWVKKTTFEGF